MPVLAAVQYSALKKRFESPEKFGLSFFVFIAPHKTGLLRAWKIFGYIAVDTLGLPTDFFPFYERREEQGEKVLERIYQGRNFGFYSEDKKNRPRSYIVGKMYGFWRTNIWYIKLMNMFPKDALIGQFTYWFSGVYHLFTDYKK